MGVSKKAGTNSWWGLLSSAVKAGSREKPHFSGAWITGGTGGEVRDSRENRFLRTELISGIGGSSRCYRIKPYEMDMGQGELEAVGKVLSELLEKPPPRSVMEDEVRLRRYYERSAGRLLSRSGSIQKGEERALLSRICAQYSTGYGAIEHLLRDERVQDIYIDSPTEINPVYVSLGGAMDPDLQGTYPTNIYLTDGELSRLVSILRFTSGRPFSEAHPVLECDMKLHNSRATAVGPPLSPHGISLAIRKHAHDPWTLLRLVDASSLSSNAAGFLNLCLDSRATILVAGPRGAGKTSLLGALLFEIDPSKRMIVIEDTPELPLTELRAQGFKVLGLMVDGRRGLTTEVALRTALRLGESVLIMGEVRGPETKTLYEAMSAGTAGSSVLGTFHADSASSVYKRAVNDLGVAPGSFTATDLIVVSGLVRPHGSRTYLRRVVQISEVNKDVEGIFFDLFSYDPREDSLKATSELRRSPLLGRMGRNWGWSLQEMLAEVALRSAIFDDLLSLYGRDIISKPETAISALETFREIRARSIDEGWVKDTSRLRREWGEQFSGGWI